ncbi:MAG: type II/IV secretion system protein [Candidatus Omnitrophica bacterium]|nr:type II/IV secretion system protein [Candidatus Omnitrophota bacterium]
MAKPVAAPTLSSTPTTPATTGGTEEPIIQLVDSVLTEAVRLRASDIHIEPSAEMLKVRYRIDGVLHEVNTPPKALHGPVTSRLKIMAGLNIAEKRLPQDGRLQLTVADKPLDVRISVLPALHGESIVMRLLTRDEGMPSLKELGFSPEDEQRWEQLIARPYGMILVTGPTGSGKTTTLYATLAVLNRPDRKLITVEDPVEYQLAGINQVHVKASVGLTFAAGLRAMLRQAPDVIMVGEIRDQETAQIAIQAALTGHLVFSTLHTNDAPSAVTRLTDMGIAPFLVASTIQGVVAQRLVRRICVSCQSRRPTTPEEQAFLGEPAVAEVVEGRGCEACHQSGFRGRVGIYELLMLTDSLRQLVVTKTQASALTQRAVQEGMRALREDGKLKIRQGFTTMTEILKATPEGE